MVGFYKKNGSTKTTVWSSKFFSSVFIASLGYLRKLPLNFFPSDSKDFFDFFLCQILGGISPGQISVSFKEKN